MKYAICAAMLLAGCGAAGTPANNRTPANAPDTCNAAVHQGLLGLDATASLILPEPKRLYGPSDVITTDFNPARLNVELNEIDIIVAITCG